jgi:hypothetical protein
MWLQDAVDELGEIWLASNDKNAVAAASAEIDRELSQDAAIKGKPLSEGLRVYDARPIRAVYSVSEPDRTVEVARVRLL